MKRTQIDTLWLPLKPGDPIYWGDSLNTEDTAASIYIRKFNLRIKLQPKTMIRLLLNNDLPVIKVQSGNLELKGTGTVKIDKSQELPGNLALTDNKNETEQKKQNSSFKEENIISEIEPDDGLRFPYPENDKLFLLSDNYTSGAFVNISPLRRCIANCTLTVSQGTISKSLNFSMNESPSFAWELLPENTEPIVWSLTWVEKNIPQNLNGKFNVKKLSDLKKDPKLIDLKNSEIIF